MAIIHGNGTGLLPEAMEILRAEVRAATKRPPVYDPECPPLTDEQLAEFRPVNGTWEERNQRMRERAKKGA